MFIEFNEHPRGQVIETDICVIGAGAAGITLTNALRNSKLDICLLETGRFESDSRHADIKTPVSSKGNFYTYGCLLRLFGGATNHWGGNSKPLDDIDFAQRDWVAHSGWPITRSDLEPWYAEANKLAGAGMFAYEKSEMKDGDWPFPDFDFSLLEDTYWRISDDPTSFAKIYRDSFETAENIRVFLNATATGLHANDSANTSREATIKSLEGNETRIRARYFVIAAGCIESARLLLASNDIQTEGLGNATDNVGRYFMQHPHADVGRIVDIDERLIRLFDRYRHGGTQIVAGIRPTEATQQAEKILNFGLQLQGIPDTTSGYYAFRRFSKELNIAWRAWKIDYDHKMPDEMGDWFWTALSDLDSVVSGLKAKYDNPGFTGNINPTIANIYVQSEQAPNYDSRIYLSDTPDSLGTPRTIQAGQILPIDKRTLRVSAELLARDLGAIGAGRVQIAEWLLDDSKEWDTSLWGGCHHMGTTRMSASPTDGVVNKDCKVHSLDNVFVASGSVFTTGGHANPTMNIMALTLRLADHLKSIAG